MKILWKPSKTNYENGEGVKFHKWNRVMSVIGLRDIKKVKSWPTQQTLSLELNVWLGDDLMTLRQKKMKTDRQSSQSRCLGKS